MIMDIFDSHAHYDDPAFDDDRLPLLSSLPGGGVTGVINAGTSIASSLESVALAGMFPFIWAAVGIHPEEANKARDGDVEKIAELAAHGKRVVAIGETGLDYHYEGFDRARQLALFEAQLELAASLKLPVIMHDREAHADTFALLRRFKPRGVLHCYSGSAEGALEAVSLGLYLGFTGVVTFKNSRRAAEAIAAIPRDRLLVETDCPYMAPEPLRGKRCDSSMLTHTITRLASLLGLAPGEAAGLTARNARELFGIA